MIVDLWTDGGCWPNPGPGAWAFVLVAYDTHGRLIGEVERSGAAKAETTNNRMELVAVIHGLRHMKARTRVRVHSDSAYVVNAMRLKWPAAWKRRGWRTSSGSAVRNRDLWEVLEPLARRHAVTWVHVHGHRGITYNERCDALCTAAYRGERAA